MRKPPNRILTDTVREIKKTRSRFFSILVLSALAVAFLAGLRTTAPDMERSADAYYDAQNLMDIEVLSTLGLTDADVAVLSRQPGVSAAEGAWTADAIVHTAGNDCIVKLLSISQQGINAPRLVAGRLPAAADECLAEPLFLTETGLNVGDTILLDTGTDTFENALSKSEFTIVGTADSPLYIDVERGSSSLGTGKVSAFLLLPRSSFNMEYYTEAYLTVDGAAGLLCYDEAYEDLIDRCTDALKPLGEERAGLRYDAVIGEANQKLDDAQKEFDKAETEANQELNDALQKLKDARRELDDGWAEYNEGKATLTTETADAKQKLADALTDLEQGELDYTEGQAEIADGWTDYEAGQVELKDGVQKYEDALPDLEKGEQEYNDALRKLQEGEADYADGLKEYNDGLAELADAAQALTDAKVKLDDAAEELLAGGQQLSAGQAAYDEKVTQLNALLVPILAAAGYTGTTNDELVDRLNDPAAQPGDMAAITGTRVFLTEKALALTATQDELTLLGTLNTLFPDDPAVPGDFEAAFLTLAATLEASRAQLASAERSLAWGHAAYKTGLEEYNEGRSALFEGAAELHDAYAELSDARTELDDGWVELRKGRRELDDGWSELNDARAKLIDGQQELDDAYIELIDGASELADARIELDDGWVEYQDGKVKLAEETAKAERELVDAYIELTDGETEYTDGLVTYENGKAEAEDKLSDARQKLNDARRDLSNLKSCEWYILGRNTNIGYASFQSNAERMGNLASVFPIIFFLVAALVCLTTMTRMVEEQRVQIGGMKALGYRRRSIAVKYVGYGFLSSMIGGLLGLLAGCTIIPYTIYTAWGVMYTLDDLVIPVYPAISAISVLAAVATVTFAALWACFSTLAAAPAQLMRPKAPPAGKRVLLERVRPVWKRMSFIQKVTVRNLFRYKKRFWMTVIGIGGCTALLITGFGLRNSIFDVLNLQYDHIFHYSSQIGLVDDLTGDELTEVSRALDSSGEVSDWVLCYQTALSVESADRTVDGYLVAAPDSAHFTQFIQLRHRKDDVPVTLDVEGAVITEKLASLLGVSVGDTITLDGDERITVPVADITENYVMHYVYLSDAYYTQVYGEKPVGNLILTTYTENTADSADAVSSELIPLSGVTSVSYSADTREIFETSMQSVNYAVIIVTLSAAALAFVVLYNLTNINISERRRELATLKVLGFYDRELSAYVYRENSLLTLFGILFGLVMGKYLHQWLVLTVEIDMLMFGRTVHPMSYAYAAALTALFSMMVNLAAYRKLKKIDMVESLKTME